MNTQVPKLLLSQRQAIGDRATTPEKHFSCQMLTNPREVRTSTTARQLRKAVRAERVPTVQAAWYLPTGPWTTRPAGAMTKESDGFAGMQRTIKGSPANVKDRLRPRIH